MNYQFKVGDRVRCSWSLVPSNAGRTGTVVEIDDPRIEVEADDHWNNIRGSATKRRGFSAAALQLINHSSEDLA